MVARPLVFCGPSGVGKSTLTKRIMLDYPSKFGFSVSHTTRLPRPGEQDGIDYHFTDNDSFQEELKAGAFLETAVYSGNNYGTSYKALLDVLRDDKWCILDIDAQGVKQVKQVSVLAANNYVPLYVFIKPPSLEHLKQRLIGRNTDSEEAISKRMEVVAEEIQYGTTDGNFDAVIVNDDLETAYEELKAFLHPFLQREHQTSSHNST